MKPPEPVTDPSDPPTPSRPEPEAAKPAARLAAKRKKKARRAAALCAVVLLVGASAAWLLSRGDPPVARRDLVRAAAARISQDRECGFPDAAAAQDALERLDAARADRFLERAWLEGAAETHLLPDDAGSRAQALAVGGQGVQAPALLGRGGLAAACRQRALLRRLGRSLSEAVGAAGDMERAASPVGCAAARVFIGSAARCDPEAARRASLPSAFDAPSAEAVARIARIDAPWLTPEDLLVTAAVVSRMAALNALLTGETIGRAEANFTASLETESGYLRSNRALELGAPPEATDAEFRMLSATRKVREALRELYRQASAGGGTSG